MKPSITRLSTAVLISSMVLSTIAPTQSHAATYEGTVNTSILNVRSSTSTSSSIVGKLTQGTTVQVYSTSNSWATINFQGQKRYVSSSYLTLKPTVTKASTSQTYKADANVNMRSAMTTTASIVTTIPKGATVTYVSTHGASGSWLKVTYNGKTGYVAQRYFSLTGGQLVSNQSDTTHTTSSSTTMHSSMVSTSPVLVTIPKGAKVVFISEHGASGSWAKVTYAGKTGYVAKRNLQPLVTVEPTTLYVKSQASIFGSMSTSGKAIGSAPAGASVKLLSTHGATGSWAKITYNSVTGYVPMRNLTESKAVETVTPYYAQRAATRYSSTSTTSSVVDTIPSGAKVDQLSAHGATGSWFKIRYNGKTGYVAARSFSLTPPSTSTEQYGPEREVQVVVANNGTLNVRTKPETGTVLGTLTNNSIVKVKPIIGSNWGAISFMKDGSPVTGYISLVYTKSYTPPAAGTKESVITHTSYPYSLSAMVTKQKNLSAQTDTYRAAPAYVSKSSITPGKSSERMLIQFQYLKETASASAKNLASLSTGTKIEVLATQTVGSATWYKIKNGSLTGYVNAAATAPTGTVNSNQLIASNFQYLKSTPSSIATNVTSISANTKLEYIGSQKVGTATWYKVKSGVFTGFVNAVSVEGGVNVVETASMVSHVFGVLNPAETVAIIGESNQHYKIHYSRPAGYNIRVFDQGWRLAKVDEITRNVSPSSFAPTSREYFQFLDLSKSANVSSATMNKSLIGKGILEGRGQAFIDASRTYSVNEIYLLSHALLETGHGKSPLATGTVVSSVDGKAVTPKKVYNMYGIGAIDGNAHIKGAERAYKEGWFTPELAIIGGAKFVGETYINNPTHRRNTLYKMRFDPTNLDLTKTRQYATDIAWATKQTTNIYNMYQQLDAYTLYFEVPKFQ